MPFEKTEYPDLDAAGYKDRILDDVRKRMIDTALIAASIFGLPAVAASLLRITEIGWQPAMLMHIVIYLSVVMVMLFRHRLSSSLKVGILLAMLLVIAGAGLETLGLAGMGAIWLLGFTTLTTIFFGPRIGRYAAGLTAVVIAMSAYYFSSGYQIYAFDVENYVRQPITWLVALLTLMFLIALIHTGLNYLHQSLADALNKLRDQRDALATANRSLKDEIHQRVQAEEGIRQLNVTLEKRVEARTAELTLLNDDLRREIREREKAEAEVNLLNGLLPVCAWCRKIRDDEGAWKNMEIYIEERADVSFSHGICPNCADEVTSKNG